MHLKYCLFVIFWPFGLSIKVKSYKVGNCLAKESKFTLFGNGTVNNTSGQMSTLHVSLEILKEINDPFEVRLLELL